MLDTRDSEMSKMQTVLFIILCGDRGVCVGISEAMDLCI